MSVCDRRAEAEKGYSLLELVMVLAIIMALASIALPKFSETLRKSQEGALRGNLGAIRSALSIYYGNNNGTNPNCADGLASNVFTTSLIPGYMQKIPLVKNTLHPAVNTVACRPDMTPGNVDDAQGWYYDGTQPEDVNHGKVWVACDHTDSKGTDWTNY